jgi:hypothetical protein
MVARVLFPVLTYRGNAITPHLTNRKSPASCSLCSHAGERDHTPTTGRPSRPSLPHIIRPRPYGIPGSRLSLMPITADYPH